MTSYTICICRLCGKRMKRYNMRVYPGDSTCCAECNASVNKEEEEIKDVKEFVKEIEKK